MNGITQWEAKEIIREKNARIENLEKQMARLVAVAAEYMGDIEFAQFKHAWEAEEWFLDPNLYWYREGKDNGIEQERGNIVEWLRGDVADDTIHSCTQAADAIEAGKHLK